MQTEKAKNILGNELEKCCSCPPTGFFRDGFCNTSNLDLGAHVVCAQVTDDFLIYSKARGNDLITARPEYNFPGLKQGDFWCLCSLRWRESYDAGCAPPIVPEASHEKTLEHISLEVLMKNTVDR